MHSKQQAGQAALAERSVPVLQEDRVVRHCIGHINAAEPAIHQVQMHFLAELSFRPDAEGVADDQYSDREFGIDRASTRGALSGGEMLTDAGHIHEPVDGSQQVISPQRERLVRNLLQRGRRCTGIGRL